MSPSFPAGLAMRAVSLRSPQVGRALCILLTGLVGIILSVFTSPILEFLYPPGVTRADGQYPLIFFSYWIDRLTELLFLWINIFLFRKLAQTEPSWWERTRVNWLYTFIIYDFNELWQDNLALNAYVLLARLKPVVPWLIVANAKWVLSVLGSRLYGPIRSMTPAAFVLDCAYLLGLPLELYLARRGKWARRREASSLAQVQMPWVARAWIIGGGLWGVVGLVKVIRSPSFRDAIPLGYGTVGLIGGWGLRRGKPWSMYLLLILSYLSIALGFLSSFGVDLGITLFPVDVEDLVGLSYLLHFLSLFLIAASLPGRESDS
jgi:hypothetical protein